MKEAVEPLGLEATGLAGEPTVADARVDLPRLAMFSTWGHTQEVGWVRHAFDTFGMPFDLIYKESVRTGNLRGLRRNPHPEPGRQREEPGVRRRVEG